MLKLLHWIPSTYNVTSLTGLEALEVGTNDSVPLDSSGLVSLTKLTEHKLPITCFTTSLMVCDLVVENRLGPVAPDKPHVDGNPTSLYCTTIIHNAIEGGGR